MAIACLAPDLSESDADVPLDDDDGGGGDGDDDKEADEERDCPQFGCCVNETTRSQVRPRGLRYDGDVAVITAIGRSTVRLLTNPEVNPVNPAMAPCTAL